MSNVLEVKVPDIGDFKNIPVIEVLVKPGDRIDAETPLVTLESDKATMEVPAPQSGTVKDIKLKVGDKVSEGTLGADRSKQAKRRLNPPQLPQRRSRPRPQNRRLHRRPHRKHSRRARRRLPLPHWNP